MTEGVWPMDGLRVLGGDRALLRLDALAAFMINQPPPATMIRDRPDACSRTHVFVRQYGQTMVHAVARRFMLPGYRSAVETGCGVILPVSRVIFTARAPGCVSPGCVRLWLKADRPAPVDRPDGANQDDAATKTTGVTLPDNSVTGRPDEDSFRSVKSATDTRMIGSPIADQVSTASMPRGIGNNSPVQARSRRPHGP